MCSFEIQSQLVSKGFNQREGIDYNDIISRVIKYRIIMLILAFVVQFN